MPTGYTAGVVDGKITEFKDFALQCARGFGALISMRDDPWDASIPDEIQPGTYHQKRLEECRQRLVELQAMTPEQAEVGAQEAYQHEVDLNAQYDNRAALENERIDAMLALVHNWKPPTADHSELKSFMIQQLDISRNKKYQREAPKKLSGSDWLQKEIKKAFEDIEYQAGEWEKEVQRAKGRTAWIKALKASL